jgi:hypothetical protein
MTSERPYYASAARPGRILRDRRLHFPAAGVSTSTPDAVLGFSPG